MSSPSSSSRPRAETPETRPAAGARRLDLDLVRGVAIRLAMGWHFSRSSSGNPVVDALQWPGGTFGWAGGDLFFVASGFLVGRLVLREHQRTGRFDSWRFSLRRALKLWPVLYVFLVVYAFAGSEPWQSYFWQNALHVQNYAGTSLTHLWSLAVEEHFYLALALLFRCSRGAGCHQRCWSACSPGCWSPRSPCAGAASSSTRATCASSGA